MKAQLNSKLLYETFENLWFDSLTCWNLPLPIYQKKQQRANEQQLNQFLREMTNHLKTFPEDPSQRERWFKTFQQTYSGLTLPDYLSSFKSLKKITLRQIIQQTDLFLTSSKQFDKELTILDQIQAIRNQWIILILQCLMKVPLKESPATLAYSLLYPYTDNLIDDPMLTTKDKTSFNERLSRRLTGTHTLPVLAAEKKIYQLISMIEQTFPREDFSNVYEAILLIQQGQIDSLKQQGKEIIPYEQNILRISIQKGGASVLADGYLIDGDLTRDQQLFTYGYGFLLQLCDDLQDVKQDLAKHHNTLFTQLADHYPLDTLSNKLIHFCHSLLHSYLIEDPESDEKIKPLIETNCLYLILFAIVEQHRYFSKSYMRNIKPHLPFSYSYCRTFKRRLKRYTKKIKSSYYGVPTIEIILELCSNLIKEEIS